MLLSSFVTYNRSSNWGKQAPVCASDARGCVHVMTDRATREGSLHRPLISLSYHC
jgi:hypothetical protein